MRPIVLSLVVFALAPSCVTTDDRAIVFYNFQGLPTSEPAEHYEHFAEVNGYAVRIGCFAVDRRQLDCRDVNSMGQPTLRPVVVECECPCATTVEDPCGEAGEITVGVVVGVVDHSDGVLRAGGVEIATSLVLDEASELFVTVEADDDTNPVPSDTVILTGELVPAGAVLRATLSSPTPLPITGIVTVLPIEDGESI